jgi:hypothetical protein
LTVENRPILRRRFSLVVARPRVWLAAAPLVAWSLLVASLVGGACVRLDPITEGICGNSVLEPREDCDGHSVGGARCGKPDSEHACELLCDFEGAGVPCPAGFVCGPRGVCARPSGRYLAAALPDLGGAVARAADFDGDGVDDLVVGSADERTLRVLLGGPLEPVGTQAITASSTLFDIVSIESADGRDLLAATDDALMAFRSRDPKGALTPTTFASYTFESAVLIGTAPAVAFESATLLDVNADLEVAITDLAGQAQLFVRTSNGDAPKLVASLPFLTSQVLASGRLPLLSHVRVDDGAAVPCDELYFVARGQDEARPAVVTVPLCDAFGNPASSSLGIECDSIDSHGGTNCPIVRELELAREGEAAAEQIDAAFPVDLDGDGALELAIPTYRDLGRVDRVLVVYAGGSSDPDEIRVGALDSASLGVVDSEPGRVLAVADLDSDGALDAVMSTCVSRISFDGDRQCAAVPETGAWLEAVVGDFDRDGRSDVAAVVDGLTGIDVLRGTDGVLYAPSRRASEGTLASLVAGDFDGDGYDDVLARSRADEDPTSCGPRDELVVFYGGPTGLSEWTSVAQLSDVRQIVVGQLLRRTQADAIDDFGVVTVCAPAQGESSASGTSRIAVFRGATSRVLSAPFPLVNSVESASAEAPRFAGYRPVALASDDELGFVATLGELRKSAGVQNTQGNADDEDAPDRVVFAMRSSAAVPLDEVAVLPLVHGLTSPGAEQLPTLLAAGRFVADDGSGGPPAAGVVVVSRGTVFVSEQALGADVERVPASNFDTNGSVLRPIALAIAALESVSAVGAWDLDGDDLDEIVFGVRTASGAAVHVLWSDAETIDARSSTTFGLASRGIPVRLEWMPSTRGWLAGDDSGLGARLVVLLDPLPGAEFRTFELVRVAAGALDSDDSLSSFGFGGAQDDPLRDVVATDINADGLLDLVLLHDRVSTALLQARSFAGDVPCVASTCTDSSPSTKEQP